MNLLKIVEEAEKLIFPPDLYCICCGNYIDGSRTYSLCDHCMDHISWCLDEPVVIDGMKVIKAMNYGIYERSIIFGLKYNGKRYIARTAGEILADRLAQVGEDGDVIVPVPLHSEKERQRGFNQSALMGKYLGRLIDRPCLDRCLIRTRHTEAMRSLSPEERKRNISGAIDFNKKYGTIIRGKKVILLDDFYTTGSTASECRKALIDAGADSVIFLAFAAR